MGVVQYGEWILRVDLSRSQGFYEGLPFDQRIEMLNYIQVCSLTEIESIQFFEQFGVDILKPCYIQYFPLEGNQIMYTGSYYVFGEILEGELDNWDVVVGQHCLSLTKGNSEVPEQLHGQIIEISFEVVLPWIIEHPIPTP